MLRDEALSPERVVRGDARRVETEVGGAERGAPGPDGDVELEQEAGGQRVGHADTSPRGIEIGGGNAWGAVRTRARCVEHPVADPTHRGGGDADDGRRVAVVQRLDPVEAEQESQNLLLTPPETGEKGLGLGRIDRPDGQVLGRGGRRIGEPFGQRHRAVVIVTIERDQGGRVPPPRASVR